MPMTKEKVERRLTIITSADMVAYSRLMAADEGRWIDSGIMVITLFRPRRI